MGTELAKLSKECNVHACVLLFSANSDKEVYEYAQRGFNVGNNWLQQHLLTLNLDKTSFMQFYMRKLKSDITNPKLYAHYCKKRTKNLCNFTRHSHNCDFSLIFGNT